MEFDLVRTDGFRGERAAVAGAYDKDTGDDVAGITHGRRDPDIAEVGGILERRVLGYGQTRGARDQLCVIDPASARRMLDRMMTSPTLRGGQLPVVGSRMHQHLACGRTGLAQRPPEHAHAARTVGVLIPVPGVCQRLHDIDTLKIGLEFIGEDAGQHGTHALPHLAATDGDENGTARIHRDEQTWRQHDRGRGLTGPGPEAENE